MKGILTLTFFSLILSPYSFANNPNMDRGAAAVDEKYVDEIKTKESAIQRGDQAGSTNSGQMYDQEDRQDRGVQKAIERQEEREGEPALEPTEGTIWDQENKKGRD